MRSRSTGQSLRPNSMPMRRNFHSDSEAGFAPEILAALVRANSGMACSYGADGSSRRVRARFCELFEADGSPR